MSADWIPDNNPEQARRIGKTLEELSELSGILARISIQGIDGVDPNTGKGNRLHLRDEIADVYAQLYCTVAFFDFDLRAIHERMEIKRDWMRRWEAHFQVQA